MQARGVVLAVVASLLASIGVASQVPESLRPGATSSFSAGSAGCRVPDCIRPVVASLHVDGALPQQAGTLKSPGVAVTLGLVGGWFGVAGLGSYYAGDSGHGTRHLLIGLGSAAVVAIGAANCGFFEDCSSGTEVLLIVGVVGYLGNWIWSTVVAGQDANAYNARVRGAGGGVDPLVAIEPGGWGSGSALGVRTRLGLRVGWR